MTVYQCVKQLLGPTPQVGQKNPAPFFDNGVKAWPLNIIHDQISVTFILKVVGNARHVEMAQVGQHLCLLQELLP